MSNHKPLQATTTLRTRFWLFVDRYVCTYCWTMARTDVLGEPDSRRMAFAMARRCALDTRVRETP